MEIQIQKDDQAVLTKICESTGLSLQQLIEHAVHVMVQDEEMGMQIKDSLFLHPLHQQHLQRGMQAVRNAEQMVQAEPGLEWFQEAWQDYAYWEKQDRKTLKRINDLIKSILREGLLQGIGKPEELKNDLAGLYSRRIDDCNRLVYQQDGKNLAILSCKGHYS